MCATAPELRRSTIDFGKGPVGTGVPIPKGTIDVFARAHILNLYPGIPPISRFFFFWRNRSLSTTNFRARSTPTSTWRKATDADEDRFRKANPMRDS